jgi:hypothetical protein
MGFNKQHSLTICGNSHVVLALNESGSSSEGFFKKL